MNNWNDSKVNSESSSNETRWSWINFRNFSDDEAQKILSQKRRLTAESTQKIKLKKLNQSKYLKSDSR
ncbi:hypothetical protein HYE18_02500 [Mycoplasmopsis bovis]|nr:hypothetical protein [Mycoplasmopsis bovis]QQH25098.1 hypothetical protein HYE18_02500 [Mycoplasmopsis bovis]